MPGDVLDTTHVALMFVAPFCLVVVAVSCARFLLSAEEFFVTQLIDLQDWAETFNHQMRSLDLHQDVGAILAWWP